MTINSLFRHIFKTVQRHKFSMSATYIPFLQKEETKQFLDSFDTVLTDCDGVLWVENNAIEGSPEALKRFRELGKKVFYVTNNSTKDRKEYVEKCRKLGYESTEEEIISTAYLAANYLKSINFQKKAYLIGSQGFAKELDLAGIKYIGLGPDAMPEDLTTLGSLERRVENMLDPEVGAVLVGFDPHFSYPKLVKAASYLSDPNCLYVATNTDERFPVSSRLVYPDLAPLLQLLRKSGTISERASGLSFSEYVACYHSLHYSSVEFFVMCQGRTGCMVAAVSTSSGRDAHVVGKPNPYVGEAVSKVHPINPKRTLMIGDRSNSDILLGYRCGFQTLLVLTGVTSLNDLEKWKESSDPEDKKLIPKYYLNKLGDILESL